MNRCPRCHRFDETVLLDQEGEPYMCDSCWQEEDEDLDRCRLMCVCSDEEKEENE